MSLKKVLTFLGWPLLIVPTMLLYLGFALNQTAAVANGGRMPVRIPACSERIDTDEDAIHYCADDHTKFVWLGDIFVTDVGVSSIGDNIIEISSEAKVAGAAIWLLLGGYCAIRKEKFYLE